MTAAVWILGGVLYLIVAIVCGFWLAAREGMDSRDPRDQAFLPLLAFLALVWPMTFLFVGLGSLFGGPRD